MQHLRLICVTFTVRDSDLGRHMPGGQLHSDQPPSTGPKNGYLKDCVFSNVFSYFTYKEYIRMSVIQKLLPCTPSPRAEVSAGCRIVDDSESELLPLHTYTRPSQSTLTSHHQLIHYIVNIKDKNTYNIGNPITKYDLFESFFNCT